VRAQGFITAQDRLLHIDFERYLSSGRLSELVGESLRRATASQAHRQTELVLTP